MVRPGLQRQASGGCSGGRRSAGSSNYRLCQDTGGLQMSGCPAWCREWFIGWANGTHAGQSPSATSILNVSAPSTSVISRSHRTAREREIDREKERKKVVGQRSLGSRWADFYEIDFISQPSQSPFCSHRPFKLPVAASIRSSCMTNIWCQLPCALMFEFSCRSTEISFDWLLSWKDPFAPFILVSM